MCVMHNTFIVLLPLNCLMLAFVVPVSCCTQTHTHTHTHTLYTWHCIWDYVSSLSELFIFLCSWKPLYIWFVCYALLHTLWWSVTRCLSSSSFTSSLSESVSGVNSRVSYLFSLCLFVFKAMCYPVLWSVLTHVTLQLSTSTALTEIFPIWVNRLVFEGEVDKGNSVLFVNACCTALRWS